MTFKTYAQAVDSLPADAKWSCSFGGAGQPGFCEYYRTPKGKQYRVSNGCWSDVRPWTWTVKVEDTDLPPGL